MGFGVSHVWKTTTGGTSWIDFTSNLPDAPVNALLLDIQPGSATGTLYAATDVGVFASDSVATGWTEVGPSPGSNSEGFLPNVAVTALHIFNPGASHRLRASTYGRGLWELSGFNLGRPVPDAITVNAPSTSAQVKLQLTAASFNGPVNLSCTVPSWAQCNFAGGSSTLSVNVGPTNPFIILLTITVTTAAPSGPFVTAIHAAAPGYSTQTQNLPVTVTGGFSFSIANTSGSQTVMPGQTAIYNLNVIPSSGTFPGTVNLSLSGCPAASACSLSSSQVLAGSPSANLVLTIATTSAITPGTYSAITVTGSMSGSGSASVEVLLTVQTSAFTFSMSNSGPPAIAAGSSGIYDIRVTPSTGTFSNPVALSFAACPAGSTCSFSATQVSAGNGTTDVLFTVATTSPGSGTAGTPAGSYAISAIGTSGSVTANTTISLTVQSAAFSFSMNSSGPATIAVGSSAKYDVTITPLVGTFPNPVALTLTGCPAVSTCSLSSSQVPAGSGTTDVFLTIATTPPALHSEKRHPLYVLLLPLPGLMIILGRIRSARSHYSLRALLALLMVALCSGCGGLQGGSATPAANPGTPVGVYTVTVTGTSGSLTANTTVSLTIQTAQ